MHIVTVCTANQCRSVMMAATLADAFAQLRRPLVIESSGVDAHAGAPPTEEVVAALRRRNLDHLVRSHAARPIEEVAAHGVDLVVAAERAHLLPIIEIVRVDRFRVYTIDELATLVASTPATDHEPLDAYLQRLTESRSLGSFLGAGPGAHDLSDPTGRGRRAHRKTLDALIDTSRRVAAALPSPSAGSTRTAPS